MRNHDLIDSKESISIGRRNLVAGLWSMAIFMILGFILVYLRDFAPGAAEWASQYSTGKHFETRLAHVHGTLFGFLNVVIGYLIIQIRVCRRGAKTASVLALLGLLMPVGILGEVTLGIPPVLVLAGAGSMTLALAIFGLAVFRHTGSSH